MGCKGGRDIGDRRKTKKDKAREKFNRFGGFSNKHVRNVGEHSVGVHSVGN